MNRRITEKHKLKKEKIINPSTDILYIGAVFKSIYIVVCTLRFN